MHIKIKNNKIERQRIEFINYMNQEYKNIEFILCFHSFFDKNNDDIVGNIHKKNHNIKCKTDLEFEKELSKICRYYNKLFNEKIKFKYIAIKLIK